MKDHRSYERKAYVVAMNFHDDFSTISVVRHFLLVGEQSRSDLSYDVRDRLSDKDNRSVVREHILTG